MTHVACDCGAHVPVGRARELDRLPCPSCGGTVPVTPARLRGGAGPAPTRSGLGASTAAGPDGYPAEEPIDAGAQLGCLVFALGLIVVGCFVGKGLGFVIGGVGVFGAAVLVVGWFRGAAEPVGEAEDPELRQALLHHVAKHNAQVGRIETTRAEIEAWSAGVRAVLEDAKRLPPTPDASTPIDARSAAERLGPGLVERFVFDVLPNVVHLARASAARVGADEAHERDMFSRAWARQDRSPILGAWRELLDVVKCDLLPPRLHTAPCGGGLAVVGVVHRPTSPSPEAPVAFALLPRGADRALYFTLAAGPGAALTLGGVTRTGDRVDYGPLVGHPSADRLVDAFLLALAPWVEREGQGGTVRGAVGPLPR